MTKPLILLDTHVLIWLDEANPRLGASAIKTIDQALQLGQILVSAITFWEVGMLLRKGRIRMSMDLSIWRKDLLEQGLCEVPVSGDIGIRAAGFNDFHGDPADRLIASTALDRSAMLLTADEKLLGCGLEVTCFDVRR